MKKFSTLAVTALLLAGCGTAADEVAVTSDSSEVAAATETVNGTGNESAAETETAEQTEAETEEAAAESTEEAAPAGLLAYMPEAGLVKNFKIDEFDIVREVKEVDGNKALEVITFGGVKTVQVSEWQENSMQMLIDTAEIEGFEEITIGSLVPTASPVVVIDEINTDPALWQVTGTDETVTVPAGTYEDVIVVTQVFDSSTSEQVTTVSHYFAPGLGFIKEKSVIENGDVVEEHNIELVSVNKAK